MRLCGKGERKEARAALDGCKRTCDWMGMLLGLWSLERTPAARMLKLFCPTKQMLQKLEGAIQGDLTSVKAWERPLVDEALRLLQPWAGRVIVVFEGSAFFLTRTDASIAGFDGPHRYPLPALGGILLHRVAALKSYPAPAVQGPVASASSLSYAAEMQTGRSVWNTGTRAVPPSSTHVAQGSGQQLRCSACFLQQDVVRFSSSQRKKAASKRRCEACT